MDIRLIVTDLDGTLLDENREISDRAVQTIREVQEKGILFTFITGRPWCGASRFARRAEINISTITCNGAVINKDNHILWSHSMDIAPLRTLLEQAVQQGMTVLCSKDGGEVAFSETDWTRVRNYPIITPSEDTWKQQADKVNIMSGEYREAFRALRPMMDALRDQVEIVCYEDAGCEIVAKGVNKAAALERYAADNGVSLAQTLAIGDNENDLEMLRLAGVSAAVANATDAAKAAADYVCQSSRTDGVVEAIRKFCLEGHEL
jgi:hypothetical protein